MSQRLDRLGIDHGIIMGADKRRKPWLPTHIASIDTLHRRETVPEAQLLIVDEAHFAVTETWKGALARYPEAKVLGMTATPIRLDGRGLGEVFEVMVQGPQVNELIKMGHLVPSRLIQPPGPNVSGVRRIGGDFNSKALAEVCDQKVIIGNIVQHWKKYAADRKTVSFAVNRAHAEHIAEMFRCEGVDCAYVDCNTSDEDRDRIWDELDNGNLRVVSSVGIISYGWDHPAVSAVIGARPTESTGLWLQQIGRGSRPHPESNKQNLLILDHAGNTQRLDVLYEDDRKWSLDGKVLESGRAAPVRTCPECYATFPAGHKTCPYCGADLAKQEDRSVPQIDGELEEYKRERRALSPEEWRTSFFTEEQRRKKYDYLVRITRERGYKPAYPAVKFKHMFGYWPPREWQRNYI
jgi:superfamily II DNA or RNA helicase